jgi:hypothetical protein
VTVLKVTVVVVEGGGGRKRESEFEGVLRIHNNFIGLLVYWAKKRWTIKG